MTVSTPRIPPVPHLALAGPEPACIRGLKYLWLPQELSIAPEIRRQTLCRSAVRPPPAGAAGLDDATGRALFAGVSRAARQGGWLSRSVLHARLCRRSDAATDPALQLRCRDHLFRHSGDPLRARPIRALRSRRRPAARSLGYAGESGDAGAPCRLRQTRAGL